MSWISVKDELPEKGRLVLVYSKDNGIKEDYYSYSVADEYWFNGTRDDYDNTVTHWQPLPEPPYDG